MFVVVYNLIFEVESEVKEVNDFVYFKILNFVLSLILDWVEKRFFVYYDIFNIDNVEIFEMMVFLGILVVKVLGEDVFSEYRRKKKNVDLGCDRVDIYIRFFLRMVFS